MRRLSLTIIGVGLLAMSSSSAFAQCAVVRLNGSNSASASGVVGGAQLGYSWQRGSFVYGLETDISAMDFTSEINTTSTTNACGGPVSVTANTNADVNWYGTVRGRLGWSSGPILFYGTGGLAYGRVGLNSTLNASEPGFSAFLNAHTSSVKTGWVAGGGIEYALRPNVFLNLGYQYVDLGTVTVADSNFFTPIFTPITLSQTASAHAQFSVVTFGISWRFSPMDTSPQGPWEGAYFGGHIGGAWGNDTNGNYSVVAFPGGT